MTIRLNDLSIKWHSVKKHSVEWCPVKLCFSQKTFHWKLVSSLLIMKKDSGLHRVLRKVEKKNQILSQWWLKWKKVVLSLWSHKLVRSVPLRASYAGNMELWFWAFGHCSEVMIWPKSWISSIYFIDQKFNAESNAKPAKPAGNCSPKFPCNMSNVQMLSTSCPFQKNLLPSLNFSASHLVKKVF
jgi:hypothetical protein